MPSATGVRLTMKFNFAQEIRAAGWSESVDLGFADLPTAIAAQANIAALLTDRVNCLGAGPLLVSAVLSAYVQPLTPGAAPVRRSTVALPVPDFPTPGDAYNKAFNPSSPYTADFAPTVFYITLQTNLSGSPVYRRSYWIAGLPDIADQTNSARLLEAGTLQAVTKYSGDLQNTNPTLGGKCGVSIRSIDRSGANAVKPCTAWNIVANTYTVPAHGFAVNQPIIAEGMVPEADGTAPRGRYLVGVIVDANTIMLQGAAPPSTPKKLGGFRAAIYTFNQVALATPQGFTKRDKGRPFGLSVGRRPKQRITRA